MKKITLFLVFMLCAYAWQSKAQCDPSSTGTNTTTLISDVTTTDGTTTNISNLASGLSPMHYGNNFATMSVTSYPGGSFDFSVSIESGTVGCAIWVDWNGDLTFEMSEVVFNTTSFLNGPFTGTITVPGGTADGDYYMRIMIDWNDSNPDDNPCALASGRGEVEDYKVTVDVSTAPSCIAPNALTAAPTSLTETTLGWTENGTATSWDVEIVDVTGGGSATGTPTASGVSNPYSAMGLTAGNDYQFYVRADCGGSGTSTWTGPMSWSQPNLGNICAVPVAATVEADCSTATPYTLDYSTAADLGTTDFTCDNFGVNTGAWFEFTAPAGGGVKVTFSDTNEYALFDSCGGTEIVCVSTATNEAVLTGLTPSATYKLAVWKDSATTGTTDVCFEEISCLAPTALDASVTSATEASISWTAGNTPPETEWEYVVQAAGTGTPAGAGTATMNNPTMLTGLTEGDNNEFYVRSKCGASTFSDWAGPFPWTQALPPVNDDCAGAIALTVNTDLACSTVTAGTTIAATASSQADDVTGTPNTDVWFSFVATDTDHRVELSNVVNQGGGTSTSTDMGMGVYDASGGCAGLVFHDDSDPNTLNLTGLTVSTTYYIRVYGWFGTIQYNNFDICVGTTPPPPPAPANDECAGAIALTVNSDLSCGTVTAGTTTSATASPETDDVTGTPNTDVWFSFVATGTDHRVELSNIVNQGGGTSTSTDMGMGVYDASGGCAGLVFHDDSDPNTLNLTGLTASTTYYVRVYGWATTIQNNNFDICIGTPPPPPANDNCADATAINALPFNSVGDATGATNTGGFHAPSGCGSMNDGVWYSFTTVNAGTVDIVLSGNTGWDAEIAIYSGSCGTFTCLDNADSAGTGNGETLTGVAVDAGTQYWINIGYWSGSTDNPEGPYTLDVSTSDTTTTLSVDDNTLEGFTVFPTIVKQELNFTSQNNVDQIAIFNLLGQQVFFSKPNVANSSVDVSTLRGGIYLVKVKVGNSIGTYKIIKE